MVLFGETIVWWKGIFLYLSNIFILPAVWYAFYIGAYHEAWHFTIVAFASTMYHLCDTSTQCFGLPHLPFELNDHIYASSSVTITLIYVLGFDHPRYKGAHLAEKHGFRKVSIAIHIILVLIDHLNDFFYIYIGIMNLVIILYKIIVIDNFRFRWGDYRLRFLISAVVLVIGGLLLFMVFDSLDEYWWTHSLWHAVVFLGLFLTLMARRHDSHEDHHFNDAGEKTRDQQTQQKRENITHMLSSVGSFVGSFVSRTPEKTPKKKKKKRVKHQERNRRAHDDRDIEAGLASPDDDSEEDSGYDSEEGSVDSGRSLLSDASSEENRLRRKSRKRMTKGVRHTKASSRVKSHSKKRVR